MRNIERCSLKENRNRFFRIVVLGDQKVWEELCSNICFFGSIAKGKHGKNEKKFDKNTIIYMIPPAVSFGNVAQLVEQGPFKAKVPGSSPGIPTILLCTILCENKGFFGLEKQKISLK